MEYVLRDSLPLSARDLIEDRLFSKPRIALSKGEESLGNRKNEILAKFFEKCRNFYKRHIKLKSFLNSQFIRPFFHSLVQKLYYSHINGKFNHIDDFYFSLDQGIGFLTSDLPKVTIIIPMHNNWEVTLKCLIALKRHKIEVPFEIILVDDGSTDETGLLLRNIRGVRVLKIFENLGFLRAVNLASEFGRGEYLVLLNNDTEPMNGWLDSMVQTIEENHSTVIVGPKLIYPDGVLQEAGGMVFSNGTAWNIGKWSNPNFAEFDFNREVDYVSGAAILIKYEFWKLVKGFDESFSPAYCEDTDLCLKAWDMGYRVFYDANSIVIHHEGLSHGKSESFGIKKFQKINLEKLYDRWQYALKKHWSVESPRLEYFRNSRGIVIIIDTQLPSFFRDSGSLRTIELCKAIQSLNYHVILVGLDVSTSLYDVKKLNSTGVEIQRSLSDLIRSLENRKNRIFAFWACKSASYFAAIDDLKNLNPNIKVIGDLLDLEIKDSKINSKQLEMAKKSNIAILVSPTEAQYLKSKCNEIVVQDIWQSFKLNQRTNIFSNTHGLLFIGGFRHTPNLLGLKWFCQEVLPILNRSGFNFPITVIGGGLEKKDIDYFESVGLILTGQIDVVEDYFQSARIFINPLINGAGLKGKLAQAMSYGLPIVSTAVGKEGFDAYHESELIIAYTPQEFARGVIDLYSNEESWNKISLNSMKFIDKEYNHEAIFRKIKAVFDTIS